MEFDWKQLDEEDRTVLHFVNLATGADAYVWYEPPAGQMRDAYHNAVGELTVRIWYHFAYNQAGEHHCQEFKGHVAEEVKDRLIFMSDEYARDMYRRGFRFDAETKKWGRGY